MEEPSANDLEPTYAGPVNTRDDPLRALSLDLEHCSTEELLILVFRTARTGKAKMRVQSRSDAAGPDYVTARELARRLLDDFGVTGLARAGPNVVSQIHGVGAAKALRLAAGLELGRRWVVEEIEAGVRARFPSSRAVGAWGRERLVPLAHEELWALALDGQNRMIAARQVARGGVHGMHVRGRDCLRAMLVLGAHAFILIHNPPSGDPTPSDHDIAFSRAVAAASALVGVPLLDHIIVANEGYASLLDRGELAP